MRGLFLLVTASLFGQSSAFLATQTIPIDSPKSVVSSDLNQDGFPDLIVVSQAAGTISVLLGNSGGTFSHASYSPMSAGAHDSFATAADFNNDGKLDLLILQDTVETPVSGGIRISGGITVRLATANGFAPPVASPVQPQFGAFEAYVTDFNLDGKLDVAVVAAASIQIYRGDGAGTFSAFGFLGIFGARATAGAAADISGDGRPDLLLAENFQSNNILVARGDGLGGLSDRVAIPVWQTVFQGQRQPASLAVGDVNADGYPDIVSAFNADNAVGYALGQPAGFLQPQNSIPAGSRPTKLVLGDFNGDRRPDYAVLNSGDNTISIGLSLDNTFAAPANSPFNPGITPLNLAALDFDRDGKSDLVMITSTGVTLWRNNVAQLPVRSPQTITLPPTPDLPGLPQDVPFLPTSSSGLAVIVTSNTPAICSWSSASLRLSSRGTCSLTVTQPGNLNYLPATPVTRSFNVLAASQTISFPPIPRVVLRTPTVTMTLSATSTSRLFVTFTARGSCTMENSVAVTVSPGLCTVTANQAGDGLYDPASPVTQTFEAIIYQAKTQTITFPTIGPQTLGSPPIPFTATSSSGLPVILGLLTGSVCSQFANAITLVTPGTCTVAAAQPGNDEYAPATSVIQSFQITSPGGLPQTISFTLPASGLPSQRLTMVATASSSLPVSFATSTPMVCQVGGTEVTFLMPGSCIVTATQAGNLTYASAPAVNQVVVVTDPRLLQTITFPTIGPRILGDPPVLFNATSSSGLSVDFSIQTETVCSRLANSITLLTTGTCTVVATQVGNAIYAQAPSVSQSFQISARVGQPQSITFVLPESGLTGQRINLSATASSGLPVSFASNTPGICTVSGSEATLVSSGSCIVVATQAGNSVYSAATAVTRLISVADAPVQNTAGPRIDSVLNAASYSFNGILAPASYGALFGARFTSLPALTLRDSKGVVQTVELIYASDTQINFLVPGLIAGGDGVLRISTPAGSAEYPVTISSVAPGLFSANGSGTGLAAAEVLIVQPDKTVTHRFVADGPIPVFSGTEVYLVLYGTGIRLRSAVSASVGDISVDVLYAGPQGTYPGLDQVNLRVPTAMAGKGTASIRLVVNGLEANAVTAQFQ